MTNSQGKNVKRIQDMINPNFYKVWVSEEPHIIMTGGRSSLKSSVTSLKLVRDFLGDPNGNVLCLRKYAKYLSTSVYEQIKWAIYLLGVEDEFEFGKSPMIIRHRETQTAFYFSGVDDPMKLKGMKVAKGYFMAIWYEELAEFSGVEDIDIVEDTFIRQDIGEGKQVRVYYCFNPPRNEFHWVNVWKAGKVGAEGYMHHHSTYLEDTKGFLSQQMLRKIENYRLTDFDYWEWMYGGKVTGMGNNVYNMKLFQPIKSISELSGELILIDTSSDTGHQISASTHLALGMTNEGDVVLLDTWYYSPENRRDKKAPSELSEDFGIWLDEVQEEFKVHYDKHTIDSAEGGLRNQIRKDLGIRMSPVKKIQKVKMIDFVHDLLAQGRFYYLDTENNQIFIEEHREFVWDEKSLKTSKPEVVEVNDHTCDAFIYYVKDNLNKLGLGGR